MAGDLKYQSGDHTAGYFLDIQCVSADKVYETYSKIADQVCIPLCKSAIASTAILVFIDYWNMVEQPLILLSDSDKYPLSIFLSEINKGEVGLAFAVAVIYMVPTILIYLYGEEYLIEGISYSGGVKG